MRLHCRRCGIRSRRKFRSSPEGEPRATNDIDLRDRAAPRAASMRFVTPLGTDFEVDTDMLREAVLHARSANAFYLPVASKIDFFGCGYEPLLTTASSRGGARWSYARLAKRSSSRAQKTPVLRKLLWFREGGEVSGKAMARHRTSSVLRISGEDDG